MNKLWSLVLIALVSLPAMADETEEKELGFWIEGQVTSRSPSRIQGWFQRELNGGPLGVFVSAARESDGYEQYFAGPSLKLNNWLKFGVGVGRESLAGEYAGTRKGAWFEISSEKWNSFGIAEDGPSGKWHKLNASYALDERFAVGVHKEAGYRGGPLLEVNLRDGIQAWVAGSRKNGETTLFIGVNASF